MRESVPGATGRLEVREEAPTWLARFKETVHTAKRESARPTFSQPRQRAA